MQHNYFSFSGDPPAANDYLGGGPSNCFSINGQSDELDSSIAIEPRIFLFTEWRFEKQGNNVQLFCRASGYPKPKITWLNENLDAVQENEDVTVSSFSLGYFMVSNDVTFRCYQMVIYS